MSHLRIAVTFLCTLFALTAGAGESCQVGGSAIPVGKTKQELCNLYECATDSNRVVLKKLTCAEQAVKTGCRSVPGDANAPFPDCCPTTLCRGRQWDH
uniref:Venom peptide HsVx1 n=1 Tax=Heterometrus spinifer TaxID=118530 RepID=LA1_HETSP|nr:RecName: Full=Venom peptide HsVx1; AltName: Full=HsTx1 protein; Flags: Precursor [Heterometrus spinifer]AFR60582.1 venom peptide HsTx1 [Heterometrus spinifer]AFX60852.1 Vx1 protein [Heterometrus spinifer]